MQPIATAEGWQLEGNSAEGYEKYLVPALMAGWAARLLDAAQVAPGERVLDVGCGTGVVARTAVARVGPAGAVAGVDVNAAMLDVARAAGASLRPPIEWRQGSATALPLPDQSFDVVVSQQMLQFVSQPEAALREMRRVLAERGRVTLSVCRSIEHSPAYGPLAEVLSRHVGPAAGAGMRSPFAPWTKDQLGGFLIAAGFRDVHVRIEVEGVRYPSPSEMLRREAASSPLAEPVAALGPAARDAMLHELEDALRPWRDDDGVVSPIEIYVASGRR